ncbi:hypothetical protein CWB99_10535 [Pseudoalteromonas rubra]|uniref:Alpha/beta hydrolase n=1 Tax=Pseudoalteromonas rubra TaxID=43658 RepID=A0A5S3WLT1_9GAMM|nr:hypothetical protein CWC00_22575 [Pseudoalteromonas rubra]TMP28814.1 hypothetical protein CWB99_10535 [Pseudoalteromonas rubra]
MDGTGKLFKPLIELLPKSLSTQVICLNSLHSEEPKEQAAEIASLIGKEKIVILAESYSGSIAYHLSLISDLNIKHIIFAASFLEPPSKLAKLSGCLPINFIRRGFIPSFVLSRLFFAQRNNKKLVSLFLSALKLVDNSTLKQRLKTISNLASPTYEVDVPCTYVTAKSDYLVSKKSVHIFSKLCVNINVLNAKGGHFIVQSNPLYFSKLVQSVIAI